jgi:hypothetical protein
MSAARYRYTGGWSAIGIVEVDIDVSCHGEALMVASSLSTIPRQRLIGHEAVLRACLINVERTLSVPLLAILTRIT